MTLVQILGENVSWLSCGRNKDAWHKEMKATFRDDVRDMQVVLLTPWSLNTCSPQVMRQLQAFEEQDEKKEVTKYAFSAQFLFKGNSIAVYEGFGWMLAFQTDMLSICIQAIKLCETASGKEETMRQLGLLVCFNVSYATNRVHSKSISRFWRWRYWYLQEKAFALSRPWPAPFQDVTAEQNMVGWEPVTGWRVDGCGGCQSRSHQVLQNVEQQKDNNQRTNHVKAETRRKLSKSHENFQTPGRHPCFGFKLWSQIEPQRLEEAHQLARSECTTRLHIFRPPRHLFRGLALWSYGRKKTSQLVPRCQFRTPWTQPLQIRIRF